MTLPPFIVLQRPLAGETTFGVGGSARAFADVCGTQQVLAALAWGREQRLRPVVLGGGSNVIVHDDGIDGLVIRLRDDAVCFEDEANNKGAGTDARVGGIEPGQAVRVVAEAGLSWDALVAMCAERGLWGVEALSGIPGSVGAAPVQNIGAYGQALSDTLVSVMVLPLRGGPGRELAAADLALGYRTSRLRDPAAQLLVRSITLRLRRRGPSASAPTSAERLPEGLGGAPPASPGEARARVLAVRASRGMLWPAATCPFGNVGSFFINPTLPFAHAAALAEQWPALPMHATGAGTKVPAAWLIEHAGLRRGHQFAQTSGRLGLSPKHALALVNLGGARARDVVAAAYVIHDAVLAAFGVSLQPEARFVGPWRRNGAAPADWPARPIPLAAKAVNV